MDLRVLMRESPASHDTLVQARDDHLWVLMTESSASPDTVVQASRELLQMRTSANTRLPSKAATRRGCPSKRPLYVFIGRDGHLWVLMSESSASPDTVVQARDGDLWVLIRGPVASPDTVVQLQSRHGHLWVLIRGSPASPDTVVQARCRPPCRAWQSQVSMLNRTIVSGLADYPCYSSQPTMTSLYLYQHGHLWVLMSESPASPDTVVQARCRPPCRGWQSTQLMLQFIANSDLPVPVPVGNWCR
ncbi:hypothetical protein Bbelb_282010 [Branchiostoma belcheri]|nr:hypothetical protein Bbelb_282010 [Branchiostoma belcheri]